MARTKSKSKRKIKTKKPKKCGHIRKCGCTTSSSKNTKISTITKCNRCSFPKGRVTCVKCGKRKRVVTKSLLNRNIQKGTSNIPHNNNCNRSCFCCRKEKGVCKLNCACCFGENNINNYSYDYNTYTKYLRTDLGCSTNTCSK